VVRDGFDVVQTELAETIGISQNYLSTMEHGKVKIEAETLLRISREFDKSLEWLLTGRGSVSNLAQGQVKSAPPKILSCEPPSGFVTEEDSVPARIVTVPVNPGTHCANPFGSTVTPWVYVSHAHAAA
jgi:DNA-binding XRE family transcriptional regulator